MTDATAAAASGSDRKATIVCKLEDLDPDTVTRIDVDEHRLAVVRIGDDVFVIGDRCSHADYSLSDGELDGEERSLECPKHGSSFSLLDGEPNSYPATKPVPTYEVSVVDGDVLVVLS